MLKKLINESFGGYIVRLRESKGYSQRKLAQVTGISNTTISRIEKNITENPDLNTLKLLAKHLGIDEIYMLEAAGYTEDIVDHGNYKEHIIKTKEGILVDVDIETVEKAKEIKEVDPDFFTTMHRVAVELNDADRDALDTMAKALLEKLPKKK